MKPDASVRTTVRRGRRWPWVLAFALSLLVIVPLVYYFLILDWEGRPCCHKNIMLSLRLWMGDEGKSMNGGPNVFPNVGGVGKASMEAIHEEMGSMEWAQNYRYVPGLHEDDPRQLVLMYVAEPTRWTWHGQAPTIFTEKKWIIVPVDFESKPGRPGECSERISEEEFKSRLRETLEFIRTNARPNWQTVVAEHTKFLESLERSNK
jgi:hypothetical protein